VSVTDESGSRLATEGGIDRARSRELFARFLGSDDHRKLTASLCVSFPSLSLWDVEDAISQAITETLADQSFLAYDERGVYGRLEQVARRDLLDERKSARHKTRADTTVEALDQRHGEIPTPEEELLRAEHYANAVRSLSGMPERRLAIVYHHVCNNEKRPALARRLGLSEKAVAKQLEKGISSARAAFAEFAGEACTTERREQMAAYAFRLFARIDEVEVRHHMQECRVCRAYYSRLRSMSAAAAAAVPLPIASAARGGAAARLLRWLRHAVSTHRRALGAVGHGTRPAACGTTAAGAKIVATVAAGAALAGATYAATGGPAQTTSPAQHGRASAAVSVALPVSSHPPFVNASTPKRRSANHPRRHRRHHRAARKATTGQRRAAVGAAGPSPAAPARPQHTPTASGGGEFF
jgi:DNA-directed RNA polymerase specialized sigma24 family protein